jgi:tetratricopeptide (TPR) repeat protein
MPTLLRLSLTLILLTQFSFSQDPPAGPAGGGGGAGNIPGGGAGGGRPGGQSPFPTDRTRDQNRQNFPDQTMQRPIFLSGKVMLDDGTPPPDFVVVERVCNGIAKPEGYTDSRGRFSFQLGQNSSVMQDASVSSSADGGFGGADPFGGSRGGMMGGAGRGVSERDLMGCELRASLPGYRSDVVSLTGRRVLDNPDVGTIVLRRMGNVEGTTISATTLQAPKEARKAFDKGRDEMRKKKAANAQKEFEKAVALYPRFSAAWYELGRIQQDGKQIEQARQSYAKALEADSKFVSPYLQLALISASENNWKDVAETTDRALKLNPVDFPLAFFYNSVANYNLRNLDAAERSAREAQKLDTQNRLPKVSHLLGMILADRQDYTGAAEQMKNYLKFAPGAQDAATVRNQLAELEKLTAAPAQP